MKKVLPISVDEELIEWLDKRVKSNKQEFRNRSHFVESIIKAYKNKHG